MVDLLNKKLDEMLIKRIDPNFDRVLGTASPISFHNFTKKGWKRFFTEAALYVYSRSGEPVHKLFITNRNCRPMQVIIEPVNQGLELDLQNPPLLSYRNDRGLTHGILFREKEDFIRIAMLLVRFTQEATYDKALEEYNLKTPIKMLKGLNTEEKSASQENDTIQESLMVSFAKPPPMPVDMSVDIIKDLKSNPTYSVDYVEKQQLDALMGNKVTEVNDSNKRNSNSFKLQYGTQESGDSSQVLPEHTLIENGTGFLDISESLPTNCVRNQQFFKFGVIQGPNPTVNCKQLVNPSTSQTGAAMKMPTKPAWMPPMLITSSAKKDNDISAGCTKTTSNVAPSVSINQAKLSSLQLLPESFTTNQVLQAVDYLLKNDPNFVLKLHEAYVKSLAEHF